MDETKELLKASFGRLEGLIGEVKELRYKIKDVQGNMDSLRAALKERPQGEVGGEAKGGPDRTANGEGQECQGEAGGQGNGDGQGNGGGRGEGSGRDEGGGQEGDDRHGHGGCGCRGGAGAAEGRDGPKGGGHRDGGDLETRVSRIERKLEYLGEKWLELDEKIFRIERRRE